MILAWHYTVGVRMVAILESGVLRPAAAYVPDGETPVVWFSTRQHWEPTANKSLQMPDGSIRHMGFEETIQFCKGGFRFGVPTNSLLAWKPLQAAARGC